MISINIIESIFQEFQISFVRSESHQNWSNGFLEFSCVRKLREIIHNVFLNILWNIFMGQSHLFDHPLMVQKLFSRPSLSWVFSKALSNEIFSISTNMWESFTGEIFFNKFFWINDHFFNLFFSLSWERIASRQQHVSDNTNTPNVNFFVVNLILNDFWSHVKRATKN
jgi:hypothetical protein